MSMGCFGVMGRNNILRLLRQILGQHHAGAAHPVNGALDFMRAGQVVEFRHGIRLESQFVMSNVEERKLRCNLEVYGYRQSRQDLS